MMVFQEAGDSSMLHIIIFDEMDAIMKSRGSTRGVYVIAITLWFLLFKQNNTHVTILFFD